MAQKQKKNRKYDRNRKSQQNTLYKLQGRQKVNKEKRIAREEKRKAKKARRYFDGKIKERGLTRKLKRRAGNGKTRQGKVVNSTSTSKSTSTPLQRLRAALESGGYTRGARV